LTMENIFNFALSLKVRTGVYLPEWSIFSQPYSQT
jgi:hypothetical protein